MMGMAINASVNNLFLLLRQQNYYFIVLNSIHALTNNAVTFVSFIHFFWTEFRYRDAQTMSIII